MRKEQTVGDLIAEVKKDEKKLDRKAFKLYCKAELLLGLSFVEEATQRLRIAEMRVQSMTMSKLKESFNKPVQYSSGMTTNRDVYRKIVVDGKPKT